MIFTDVIKAVNGHLEQAQASMYASVICDDNDALWNRDLPPGVSKAFARGKCAQRLITNPALPFDRIEALKKYADDPEVQNRAVVKEGTVGTEPAVDYMKAREVRVENYNAKYGTNVR